MRRSKLLFSFLFVIVAFGGACTKTEDKLSPEDQAIQYLTGSGNRYWKIKALWINGVQQTLTVSQLEYWKVYTISIANPDGRGGRFNDLSGFIGSWSLSSATQISETVENLPAGPVSYKLDINKLGTYEMDVEERTPTTVTRTTYYAN